MVQQERGKFSASVAVDKIVLQYRDGHTEEHVGEDARALGLRPYGKPHSLSGLDLIREHHKDRNVTPLTIGGDKALSTAAKFGTAIVPHVLDLSLTDHLEPAFAEADDRRTIVRAKIGYTITVRRVADG
jgi:hypothetical protein